MFTKFNKAITDAIQKIIDESVIDFSKWWSYDFFSEHSFNSEEELRTFSKDTLDCIKLDFIHYIFEGFFYNILSELGFYDGIDEYPNTDTQVILVEEISNIVKVELRKKLEREWN